MSYSSRRFSTVADDLDGLRARCAGLADVSFGLAMIFGAVVAILAVGGLWLNEPLLASSAGVALVATAAFALSGQALARAANQTPRVSVVRAPAFRRGG